MPSIVRSYGKENKEKKQDACWPVKLVLIWGFIGECVYIVTILLSWSVFLQPNNTCGINGISFTFVSVKIMKYQVYSQGILKLGYFSLLPIMNLIIPIRIQNGQRLRSLKSPPQFWLDFLWLYRWGFGSGLFIKSPVVKLSYFYH